MSQARMHTLLVTADREWPFMLTSNLTVGGFAPLTIAPTGESALHLVQLTTPRLTLVDLRLADCNPLELCRRMLALQPTAKVLLVGDSVTPMPHAAVQAGVAGYVDRNLSPSAWVGLLSYILSGGTTFSRSVVEGVIAEAEHGQRHRGNFRSHVTIGQLVLDPSQRRTHYGEYAISLTPREFSLLLCLARNADHVVTFDQLLSDAWGYDEGHGTPAQVRLYVARLRQKLLADSVMPDCIVTERGLGYRLLSAPLQRVGKRLEWGGSGEKEGRLVVPLTKYDLKDAHMSFRDFVGNRSNFAMDRTKVVELP